MPSMHAVRGAGRAGVELSDLLRLGCPRVCQPQVIPWAIAKALAYGRRTWCPAAAPNHTQCAARGARDHGLKVVGLPSRFANFQTDIGSQEGLDYPSPSPSPVADDWWSSGLMVFMTHLVQCLNEL